MFFPPELEKATVAERVELQEPVKDVNAELPVALIWRPVLQAIVAALVRGDYALAQRPLGVAAVSTSTSAHIANCVADYGETLAELTPDTWRTSISQWNRTYWEVLVDLQTVESGRSDLVLHVHVFEVGQQEPRTEPQYRFEIYLVFVP